MALEFISSMITAAIFILIVMLAVSAVTVIAFSWAATRGQFEDPAGGSRVIFDADEPEGMPTEPELKSIFTHRKS